MEHNKIAIALEFVMKNQYNSLMPDDFTFNKLSDEYRKYNFVSPLFFIFSFSSTLTVV